MKCLIISNGDIHDYNLLRKLISAHDFIICADGGGRHLFHIDKLPDILVGDLDSIDEKILKYFHEKNVRIYRFPSNKDYTDTELAIKYALENKATEITFVGVIGNRMDHTMANITLLMPLLNKGIHARIVNENNEIMIANKDIEIEGNVGDCLSIIPLSEKVEGVTLENLEYPLNDVTIPIGSSIGISNRFKSSKAIIKLKSGNIFIVKAKD